LLASSNGCKGRKRSYWGLRIRRALLEWVVGIRERAVAIFMTSMRTISRSRGDSATAAAAYRAGVAMKDERLGVVHDYSRRHGVERVRLMVPPNAPAWATNAVRLWNTAEAAEARKNARVARELIVALPCELDASGRAALADEIGQMVVGRYGAAVMVAVHAPNAHGDQRNHHCHVLFSTRVLGAQGFEKKIRVLDDREQGPREVEAMRRAVAELTNARLTAAGIAERVDHRTLATQAQEAEALGDYGRAARLTREPTEHVGRAATALVRRGGRDERAEMNGMRAVANEAALAAYLDDAQRECRLLAPVSDRRCAPVRTRRSVKQAHEAVGNVLGGSTRLTRASGRDAEVLNAQAAAMEEGVRVGREGAQAYIDGLRHTAERQAAVVDAYLAITGQTYRREAYLDRCAEDPRCLWVLQRSLDARAALRALREEFPERRRRYGRAMVASTEARRAVEALEGQQPPVWRPLTRRQWAEKRRADRARLDGALRAEREARSLAAGSGDRALEDRQRALRAKLRDIEGERRKLFIRAKPASVAGSSVQAWEPTPPVRDRRRVLPRRLKP
jgi:hypothetical protein